jgi:transcriptional regulator
VYVPPHFRVDDVAELHAAIRAFPLATLVTDGPNGLTANHVPMLLDADAGPHGALLAHVARANAQWRDLERGVETLAIFCGPNAYVTPSWYATKRETGAVVPTWNYIAVHAYGRPRTFDDPERLRTLVERLTAHHEAERAEPWAVGDAPPAYIAGQLRGIVGIELRIERLVGKWKLSQNRGEADRDGVADGLAASPAPRARAVAEAMRDRGTGRVHD